MVKKFYVTSQTVNTTHTWRRSIKDRRCFCAKKNDSYQLTTCCTVIDSFKCSCDSYPELFSHAWPITRK